MEARRQGSYSPLAVIRLDGRQWAPLVRGQKDRLLRKASVLLVEACRPYQAGRGSAYMARFVDDLGTIVGGAWPAGRTPSNTSTRSRGPRSDGNPLSSFPRAMRHDAGLTRLITEGSHCRLKG